MPPEKPHWAELFTEVVTSGLCTGCAACIVACPYDVLSYDDTGGRYKPFHIDAEGGPESCTHAAATRLTDGRPIRRLISLVAATNFCRSTPVAIPMPSSM